MKIDLPINIESSNGLPYGVYFEITFPLKIDVNLPGTDCPAEECSACGELFEEGANFCSWCGRVVYRNNG